MELCRSDPDRGWAAMLIVLARVAGLILVVHQPVGRS